MKKKIELSVSEMRRLREDGYSNKDIARILDISLPIVYRYIGCQGCRMDSMATTTSMDIATDAMQTPQPPEITVISRVVSIGGYLFDIPSVCDTLSVLFADGQSVRIPADDVDGFVFALGMAKAYMDKQRTINE